MGRPDGFAADFPSVRQVPRGKDFDRIPRAALRGLGSCFDGPIQGTRRTDTELLLRSAQGHSGFGPQHLKLSVVGRRGLVLPGDRTLALGLGSRQYPMNHVLILLASCLILRRDRVRLCTRRCTYSLPRRQLRNMNHGLTATVSLPHRQIDSNAPGDRVKVIP